MSDPTASAQAFATQVLRRPLWPHQVEAAESTAFITTVAAARRTGKSEMAEVLAMWTALRSRRTIVLILSATEDAARRLTESIGQRLNDNALTKGAVVADNATRVRLSNGSQIVSLPASQRQVRGYGKGVRLVILDEAGFQPPEMWAAARYAALDERPNGARILICGTPWGATDHFFRRAFRAGLDGDPDHASHQWRYDASPDLRAQSDYLERERRRVSPAEYAAEVLGEWSDAAGSLFSRELLEACTADVVIPELSRLVGPARPIVGCDWGVSYDRSAAAVVYRLPIASLNPEEDGRPRLLVLPYVWPQKTEMLHVVNDIVAAPTPWAVVASETNGVGAMPTQELLRGLNKRRPRKRILTVHTSAASKTVGYSALLGLMERRQLVLPRHPDLLRQLAGLRFEVGHRGFLRIEADDAATHDDTADALMLAALPIKESGRMTSRLMRLADPRVAVPDERLPEFDQPVITTGDGLRLHERPSLQSVAGQELTHFSTPNRPRPDGTRHLVIPAPRKETP